MNGRLLTAACGVMSVATGALLIVPAVGEPPAATQAVAGPTTVPAADVRSAPVPVAGPPSPEVAKLIKQLGSDSPEDRESAQKHLVDIGQPAIDPLKKAADEDADPEVRTRAAAAVDQIFDRDANDASLITIHRHDVPAVDVLNDISAQARMSFNRNGTVPMPAAAKRTMSLDADRKPFWDVMTDLCTQLSVCPLLDSPTRNSLHLFPTPRSWITGSPHQIVGPYWVGVAGLYRLRSIDLMGPQQVDDQFIARLIVYPEPKLMVTLVSEFKIKEAVDDAGNSLVPAANAGAMPLAFLRTMRMPQASARIIEAKLLYPAHPGKQIAVLRGGITVSIAQGVQKFFVDDVLTAPKQTNPIATCKIVAAVNRKTPDLFELTLDCTRQDMPDDQWFALMNRVGDATLEDADGHPLYPLTWSNAVADGDNRFKSTALFTRNVYNGAAVGRQVNSKTGEPKKLVWNVAAHIKQVPVEVTFHDLPMP